MRLLCDPLYLPRDARLTVIRWNFTIFSFPDGASVESMSHHPSPVIVDYLGTNTVGPFVSRIIIKGIMEGIKSVTEMTETSSKLNKN